MLRPIFVIFSILFTTFGFAQKIEGPKNSSSFAIGTTYVPHAINEKRKDERGIFVESIGLDYQRQIHRDWEIGVALGYELGRYTVSKNYPLNRHNAFSYMGTVTYTIPKTNLDFFVGFGLEIEEHENLPILSLGTDYTFHLSKGFFLSPSFNMDYKTEFGSATLSIALGKEF